MLQPFQCIERRQKNSSLKKKKRQKSDTDRDGIRRPNDFKVLQRTGVSWEKKKKHKQFTIGSNQSTLKETILLKEIVPAVSRNKLQLRNREKQNTLTHGLICLGIWLQAFSNISQDFLAITIFIATWRSPNGPNACEMHKLVIYYTHFKK